MENLQGWMIQNNIFRSCFVLAVEHNVFISFVEDSAKNPEKPK